MKLRLAFTLVELMVVIAIIVVLLALLAPALDKAVYQAELAVCAARLHVNQVAVTTYAFDSKRSYPNRKVFGKNTDIDPVKIVAPGPTGNDFDDRLQLHGYVQINKMLVCPLVRPVDLEIDSAADTFVLTSYARWWGWRYAADGALKAGMYRVGDRFEDDRGNPHSVLVADYLNTSSTPGTYFQGTHPEKQERHLERWLQHGPNPWANNGDPALTAAFGYMTLSWRESIGLTGSFDMNFVMSDGSLFPARDYQTGRALNNGLVAIPTFSNVSAGYKYNWVICPVPPN